MDEFKYLDSSKIDEAQAINLINKHFPISIQAFIQIVIKKKKFFYIWEKLGELENTNKNQVAEQPANTAPPCRQKYTSKMSYN